MPKYSCPHKFYHERKNVTINGIVPLYRESTGNHTEVARVAGSLLKKVDCVVGLIVTVDEHLVTTNEIAENKLPRGK